MPIVTSVASVTTDETPTTGGVAPTGSEADAVDSHPSVYQRVLGEDFAALDPHLQKYFGPIPYGWVGRGSGVYAVAGSPHRWLGPLLAFLAWRHILFPNFEHNVPFTVTNTSDTDGRLSAVRTFQFSRGTRIMEDTLAVVDGHLHDRLGKRRGLDVAIRLSVVSCGLRMTSTGLALRVGRVGIPLPPVARMTLDERTDPADSTRQRVDVRIVSPVFGEMFRYTGTFTYRLVPIA